MKKDELYLDEDKDLLEELQSVGPMSTGTALETQKYRLQSIQIRAGLRDKKSRKDWSNSSDKITFAMFIMALVQVLVAVYQLLFSVLADKDLSANYRALGIFMVLAPMGILIWAGKYLFSNKK